MKVIFIKNLPKVARQNDVKEQPDGYVRNFLIPKGFVIPATPEALKKLQRTQNEIRVEKEVQSNLFKKNLQSVDGVGVTLHLRANEKGHLFKAVHGKDIAEALLKQHHIIIDTDFIKLEQPIKEIGEYTIPVEALGMTEKIQVVILSEEK